MYKSLLSDYFSRRLSTGFGLQPDPVDTEPVDPPPPVPVEAQPAD